MDIDNIKNLPSIRQTVEKYEIWASKKLGQNFIFDQNLTAKIVNHSNVIDNDVILEIGSGPGGLTRQLVLSKASKVLAVEVDKRALSALEELKEVSNGKLEIISQDALKISIKDLAKKYNVDKIKIIANLPYNIATKLLTDWLEDFDFISSITVMVQKEVAQRICSKKDSKSYSRLSVICQLYYHCNILFDVDKRCFTPAPKVTSSVIYLEPKKTLPKFNKKRLEEILLACFSMRRKMLKANLKKIFDNPIQSLTNLNINPENRAENLSVEDFCKMSLL